MRMVDENFPVNELDDLPRHLQPFAAAMIRDGGFPFPLPSVGGNEAEEQGEVDPGMTKPVMFAMQTYDFAILLAFYKLALWGIAFQQYAVGKTPREAETYYAGACRRLTECYDHAMQALYDFHGHTFKERVA